MASLASEYYSTIAQVLRSVTTVAILARMRGEPRETVYDRVVLLLLFALFLLFSPIVEWWAADDSPWYAPYLIWALLIALTFALQRYINRRTKSEQNDDD